MKLSPKWVIGIVAGLYFLVFSGRGWTPSPFGFGVFLAAVAIAVKISRRRAAKRAHEARIVATGHRAELAVEEIVPGGGQIKMNGRVTRHKVDVRLERGIVLRGMWLEPGALEPGQVVRVAYDERTLEAVMLSDSSPPPEPEAGAPSAPPEPPPPRPATSRSTEELAKQIGLGG